MKRQNKEQRINESAELHQRIEDLEAEATKRKKTEESLREALKEVKQLKNQLREENLYLTTGWKRSVISLHRQWG